MKLYRFAYSCYARYVQAAIDLCGVPCEVIDVAFGDRNELAQLTGGSIMVPVLVRDDGRVLKDSRVILETLIEEDPRFSMLIPASDAGPVWAYADWATTVLEDCVFRLASPGLALRFPTPFERALFVFTKERKFGAGCIAQWEQDAEQLFARTVHLLEPTSRTLRVRPFLFGQAPTLADASLYGQLAMLDFGAPDRVASLDPAIVGFKSRMEARFGPPPYGRVAQQQRATAELDRCLTEATKRLRTGSVDLIVVRTSMHERACPTSVELGCGEGLLGDRWSRNLGKLTNEVSLMDVRVAGAIAARDDWSLFGDNLFVDFDLGHDSLQTGDRVRVGSALLEITDEPHHGCRKFSARFGPDALRWVNHKSHAAERRRGLFARVIEAGAVALGDTITRA